MIKNIFILLLFTFLLAINAEAQANIKCSIYKENKFIDNLNLTDKIMPIKAVITIN